MRSRGDRRCDGIAGYGGDTVSLELTGRLSKLVQRQGFVRTRVWLPQRRVGVGRGVRRFDAVQIRSGGTAVL